MKTADVSELRDNARTMIRRVSRGEEIEITLDGKPFARLIPEKPEETESDRPTGAPGSKLSK
jgi:prevent-host-death family protein